MVVPRGWTLIILAALLKEVTLLPSYVIEQQKVEIDPSRPGCISTDNTRCRKLYSTFTVPNVYGDITLQESVRRLEDSLSRFTQSTDLLVTFLCSLYMPPCSSGDRAISPQGAAYSRAPLPCLNLCELAELDSRKLLTAAEKTVWPISCSSLPTEYCIDLTGAGGVSFVQTSIKPKHFKLPSDHVASFAPLDVELGNEESYELEVVTLSDGKVPARRYDVTDLGDPELFQGWADVQGIGAANDYCRVVGKGKRRFISCNLAGSTDQGHHYVSKLGFDVGHPNTWFMRDMDGDRRDDYCRCQVSKNSSRITCMKAGVRGFYGSTTQGGNQHTFSLPGTDSCHSRRYNHVFGE